MTVRRKRLSYTIVKFARTFVAHFEIGEVKSPHVDINEEIARRQREEAEEAALQARVAAYHANRQPYRSPETARLARLFAQWMRQCRIEPDAVYSTKLEKRWFRLGRTVAVPTKYGWRLGLLGYGWSDPDSRVSSARSVLISVDGEVNPDCSASEFKRAVVEYARIHSITVPWPG
jgi:hypothetical protein